MDKNQINSLEKVLSDEKVMEKILSANSEQDINNILKENNINLKPDEIKLIIDSIKNAVKTVSAEELENISGGKITKEDFQNNVINYTGEGSRVGFGAGFVLGGAVAAIRGAVELAKSKGQEGYLKGLAKLVARTTCATLAGTAVGGVLGATAGSVQTLIDNDDTNPFAKQNTSKQY